jgi:hypothetical protein
VVLEHVAMWSAHLPSPLGPPRPHSFWASKKAVASSLRAQKYASTPAAAATGSAAPTQPRGPLPRASHASGSAMSTPFGAGRRGDGAEEPGCERPAA